MRAKAHATEPCHAGVVDGRGEVTLVCTRPDRHPKRAHNKDRRAAEEARGETMARLPRNGCQGGRLRARRLPGPPRAATPPGAWRASCWGSDPSCLKCHSPVDNFTTPLLEYASDGPVQLERVALALAFGAAEPELRQDWPWWTSSAARRHFAYLESQGYPVSPAEKLALDGKAPQ